jgi:hypothetical protein
LPNDYNFPLIIPLLGYDSDGDFLTYSIANAPVHGTVTIVNNGTGYSALYTPPGWSGVIFDEFTYTANDGKEDSSPATVKIIIAP